MKASGSNILSEFASIFNGKTPSRADQRLNGHPVLKIRDIDEHGQFRGKFESFVDGDFAEKFSNKTVRQGDTLILNAAHNADYVGSKQFIAKADVEGALATGEWLVVRPDGGNLDAQYAHYWLTYGRTLRALRDMVKGIHLYPKDVARLSIGSLPPIPEQRRIAEILDKADALRQKRKRAIALLEGLKQSIFLEMFSEANKSWPSNTIGEVGLNIRTGPFGSQLLHSEFVDEGIAVLGIDNVVQNTFSWGKPRFITAQKYKTLIRYRVNPGDILITIMGTIGRCALVPNNIGDAINTKHLCCITPDKNKILPEYLQSCFLDHPKVLQQLGQQSKGAIMDGLNMGIIKGLSIPVPPIRLQQQFANSIKAVSAGLCDALESEFRTKTLFSSLQHRAFSGRL